MANRPKLSVKGQIEHMKQKNIKFNIIDEETAIKYLENNTYYFKLKAYAKLFEKYSKPEKAEQYVNLEFAYLKELAIIDMHLRHLILKIAVDVEHSIKVQLMRDFANCKSDGYEIVEEFFESYPDMKDKILRKKDNSYCEELINKLQQEGYALWNLIEIVSFGDFINLYKFFYEKYSEAKSNHIYTYPMYNIKSLRNAAAHNNCIMNQLAKPKEANTKTNSKVISFIANMNNISKTQRQTCMQRQAVHDFVTLLYVVNDAIQSEGVKKHIFTELDEFINVKAVHHKEYFTEHNELNTIYDFLKKIIDNLVNK